MDSAAVASKDGGSGQSTSKHLEMFSKAEDYDKFDDYREFGHLQILLGIPGTSASKQALPQISLEIEPKFVNFKQHRRIVKRRKWKADNTNDLIRLAKEKENEKRKGFKYNSRHLHAKRRKRGPNGKFLTKAELAELENKESSIATTNDDARQDANSKDITDDSTHSKSQSGGRGLPQDNKAVLNPFLHGWSEAELKAYLHFANIFPQKRTQDSMTSGTPSGTINAARVSR
mmetsp:Transcript_27741/g.67479  ORF Transcript_27741/g.67479 Transcript_27741/m.67479 type:complete len:231 (-) Transcript_27741:193-885(-)